MIQICDLCLSRPAIYVYDDTQPNGPSSPAYYCEICAQAKRAAEAGPPVMAPRPRITLKQMMILVAIFALANVPIVAAFRSGMIQGTRDQIRIWEAQTYLTVNAGLAILIAIIASFSFLEKLILFRRSAGALTKPGGAVPQLSIREWIFTSTILLAITLVAVPFLPGSLPGSSPSSGTTRLFCLSSGSF